jgi:hypothetical protein
MAIRDEPTTIGELLLAMGAVTEAQLDLAINDRNAQTSRRLGEILVEYGFCTDKEVHRALEAQEQMRKGGTSEHAMVYAQLALERQRRPDKLAQQKRLLDTGRKLRDAITGEDYPAVDVTGAFKVPPEDE